jgi:hypothetical protein
MRKGNNKTKTNEKYIKKKKISSTYVYIGTCFCLYYLFVCLCVWIYESHSKFYQKWKKGQVWWHMPVFPAMWEAEIGGSQFFVDGHLVASAAWLLWRALVQTRCAYLFQTLPLLLCARNEIAVLYDIPSFKYLEDLW